MKSPRSYVDPAVLSEILRLARKVANPQKVQITLQGAPLPKKQ